MMLAMGWDRADPALGRYSWKRIRAYWRAQRRPCWRCGAAIDYAARWPHPLSMVVGHLTSRVEARALGWSEARINSIGNTLPEHASCSNRSGAALGRQRQAAQKAVQTVIADRW
jgi:hypothetical protein